MNPFFPRASLIALVATLVLTGCEQSRAADAPPPVPAATNLRPDQWTIVRTDTLTPTVTVTGTLEARRRAVLRVEATGAVATRNYQVGDPVAAGVVLATLRLPTVSAAHAAARAQAEAGRAALAQAETEAGRTATLLAAGGASRSEADEARSRVQAARAAVAAAEATLATASADEARAVIRAPFAGIIAVAPAAVGTMLQPGDEIATIVDPRSLEADLLVPFNASDLAEVGARVTVAPTAFPRRTIGGRIARRAPSLDPATRQLAVRVTFDGAATRLPAGAIVHGTLHGATLRGARIPVTALDPAEIEADEVHLTRLVNGVTTRVIAHVRARDLTRGVAVVTGALADGDTLVLGGARRLAPGTRLTLTTGNR